MRNFDIYWVRFEYEDRDGYKVRPALILNKNILCQVDIQDILQKEMLRH